MNGAKSAGKGMDFGGGFIRRGEAAVCLSVDLRWGVEDGLPSRHELDRTLMQRVQIK